MTTVQRRTIVSMTVTLLMVGMIAWGAPAHAACTTVPASTPGSTVRLAGQDHRIPSISGISVCTAGGSVPLVWVEASGGSCSLGCLSIGLTGDGAEAGSVTISYQVDGSPASRTVEPGGVGGPGDSCLLSVGAPQAPRPTCFNALNVEVPEEDVQELEDVACETIPDQGEWGQHDFCEDPQEWGLAIVRDALRAVLDTIDP